jgi:hypothetical protein
MTGGQHEGLVAVEHRLDRVLAGGQVGQALDRISEDRGVEDDRLTGPQALHVLPQHLG